MSQSFQALMQDFARCLGLGDSYQFANPSSFQIHDLVLHFEEEDELHGGFMMLYCQLGTAPAEHELTACRAMLEANLLWAGTGDSTLGMNSETREVTLACQFPPLDLKGEHLMSLAERFLVVADIWRTYLSELTRNGDTAAAPQPPQTGPGSVVWG